MGFPVEMELPWESLGNWEWLQLSNGNGNGSEHRWLWEWTLFLWEKFPRIFLLRACPRAQICAPCCHFTITYITFWRMTVEIFLSDFQSIANGIFRIFTCNDRYLVFYGTVFLLFDCRATVCVYTALFCCACLWMGWMGMGMRGNGNVEIHSRSLLVASVG